ncbi:chaperone modulator CbpM [Dermatobacter hominis]|uniref:chaperone modulator CbpM n=1 Tax=Dermatobacter hominis TaxID=2884263 RepID=UPI001D107580|nr:chaperone modulator CbpM [Dermatobacter hominis]UDY37659.1 chaperone modulator CbpM [Dermatobacter hominis]
MTAHVLARPWRLGLDDFARAVGEHPDLVRRFVALGLIEATTDVSGELWFEPGQIAETARLRRLRAGFALNYAALGLVADLLDRLDRLEAERRRRTGDLPTPSGARRWR